MRAWLALWALCVASALPLLTRSDPHTAAASVATAEELAGDRPLDRAWLEAARINSAVMPWQPGFGRARAVVRDVGATRRAALVDDRGGRRGRLD